MQLGRQGLWGFYSEDDRKLTECSSVFMGTDAQLLRNVRETPKANASFPPVSR
jgi:hypothetical protein